MPPLVLDPTTARCFMRRALLLDEPAPDVASALAHHGYIQIDPINVCGRMHDLILRNRVRDYREGDLMRHLHGDSGALPAARRLAFEHHLPSERTLVALPLDAWPFLLAEMRRRAWQTGSWSGRLSPVQKKLSARLLAEIAERGPMSSEDFADTGRARAVWGASTQAKATLQKLFFHGRLLLARRSKSNRRYYDLPERVLPECILKLPAPPRKETARWEVLLKLRQRRLTPLKRTELPLVADLVQPVTVEGCPTLYLLKSDLPLLAEIQDSGSEISNLKSAVGRGAPLLLAPLDPLIYSRPVTAALWDFDYTWEVYTPAAKRKRGYYALPVLSGHALVGHVDPKVDRLAKKLRIQSRAVRRGHAITGPLQDFARWLGLR
jgi:uncharacterized protein YcaQ